jgi:dTDP-glucose 4,6-dehydratase
VKRLLLTGIGGSIGIHAAVHFLHNTDWEVVGIDSFRHKGLTDRVSKMFGEYHPEYWPRLTVLTHDLRAPISDMLAKRIGPIDYVVQMASLSDVHESMRDPERFIVGNTQLAVNVLEYARKIQPAAFVLVSTDEVYGPTDGTFLHKEWSPIVPSNAYSASKVAQEAAAIAYWRSWKLPLIIVNLMNNFGEMQSPSKFPAIIQRKVRAGELIEVHANANGVVGTRCYIHSRNSADAILFLLRNVPPRLHWDGLMDRPERFNIVGKQYGNLDLVRLIAGFIGREPVWALAPASASRPGHDVHYGLDGSKLAALGWRSPVPFEESMRLTVEWYEKNPEWLDPH